MSLTGVHIFEVDHLATQGDKQRHLAELPPALGSVTFVAIDFERESLDTALARAGHDRAVPTCLIWEGVVMYLTRDAMRATLARIADRSAPGSMLIVNYHAEWRRLQAKLIFRLIGEPQISAWTPEEMAADLASVGFVVHEDSGMTEMIGIVAQTVFLSLCGQNHRATAHPWRTPQPARDSGFNRAISAASVDLSACHRSQSRCRPSQKSALIPVTCASRNAVSGVALRLALMTSLNRSTDTGDAPGQMPCFMWHQLNCHNGARSTPPRACNLS